MNTLESSYVLSPNNKDEECATFVIDDVEDVFSLFDIMVTGRIYTYSCWIKSDVPAAISVGGNTFSSTSEWSRLSSTFVANQPELNITFINTGTYYIYHAKLETGNKATDWSPNPDDVEDKFESTDDAIAENSDSIDSLEKRATDTEATLEVLGDKIVTVVTGEDGSTMLQQSGTGWKFNITNTDTQISTILAALESLDTTRVPEATRKALDELAAIVSDRTAIASYVHVGETTDSNGNPKPYIELGTLSDASGNTNLKLRITNTEMYFMNGPTILTTVTNQQMVAEHLMVNQELQIGDSTGDNKRTDGVWVWKQRANGNLGLVWKEMSN